MSMPSLFQRPPTALALTVLTLGCLMGLYGYEFFRPTIQIDDAYISYRYAQNLVDGHGLVYNIGERVEGYTNLLWTLMVAGGIALGVSASLVGHWLGFASGVLLLLATYWSLGAKPWETLPALHQREMGHACEWETSMILRLGPHLVGDYRAATTVEFGNPFAPATRGWITKDRTIPGHIGSPQLATAEKGEHLFNTFATDVAALLERVIAWDGQSWIA